MSFHDSPIEIENGDGDVTQEVGTVIRANIEAMSVVLAAWQVSVDMSFRFAAIVVSGMDDLGVQIAMASSMLDTLQSPEYTSDTIPEPIMVSYAKLVADFTDLKEVVTQMLSTCDVHKL